MTTRRSEGSVGMCGTGTGGKGSGQRRGAGEAWRRKQLMEGDGETMVETEWKRR